MISSIGDEVILSTIEGLEGLEDIRNFINNLSYNDVRVVKLTDSDKHVVVFDGRTIVENKDKLKRYFTKTLLVPKRYYSEIYNLVESEEHTSTLAKRINDLIGFENSESFGTTLRVDNVDFLTKKEALRYFYYSYNFDELKEKCEHWEELDDGQSILLDGVAFVSSDISKVDSSQDYSMGINSSETYKFNININGSGRKEYPIRGLLMMNGKVKWTYISDRFFKTVNTDSEESVRKLYTLAEEGLCQYYREVKAYDRGVIQKPYPVAVIGEDEYVYAYKLLKPYSW